MDGLVAATGAPIEALAPVVVGDRFPSPELADACDRAVGGRGRLRSLALLPRATDPRVATPFSLRPQVLHGSAALYGRDNELQDVADALVPGGTQPCSTRRACLLRGPSGIGKTALSIHVAMRLKGKFAHGRLYEDLRLCRGMGAEEATAEVLDRLLRGLGVAARYVPRTLEARAALYKKWMADRSVLVIVDGLTNADQVKYLLPGSATASVLLIGRDVRIAPEDGLELTLPGLADVPALKLLNASGKLDLTDSGTVDVARWLLRRCGTRPLTLRLIGGCVGVRGRAVLDTLDHSLANVADGDGEAELEDVAEACLAVLPLAYRQRVERLALHPGESIGCGAAASLLDESLPAAKASLDDLCSSGFLDRYTEKSWHFPESLIDRFRATSGMPSGAVASVQPLLRLFGYYLESVAAADLLLAPSRHRFPLVRISADLAVEKFHDKEEARAWMDGELDNLLAVASGMCSLAGEVQAGRGLTAEEAVQVATACWQFAYAARGYLFEEKPWRIWVSLYRVGLDAAYKNQKDRLAHGLMLANLGMALGEFGDLGEACRRQNSARWAFEEAGDEYGATNAIHNEAWLQYYSARYQAAYELAEKAREFYRFRRNVYNEAIALDCMARSLLAMPNTKEAIKYFQQALKKGRSSFDRADLAQMESHLGEAFIRCESFADAQKAFRRARRLSVIAASRADEVVALEGLIEAAHRTGDSEKVGLWQDLAEQAHVVFGSEDHSRPKEFPVNPEVSPASAVTAPPLPGTGQPDDEVSRNSGPRILAIDTDWVSVHGGLTTFNRRLCVALADAGAEVYCLVAESEPQDRDRAAEQKVWLLEATRSDDDTVREALMRRPRDFPADVAPDLVIGHGRITGRIAACQQEDHYPTAARLHFIHTAPEETEWLKSHVTDAGLRAETRANLERQLAKEADLVFAVGPKLRDDYEPQLRGSRTKVHQIDPGFDGVPVGFDAPPDGTHTVLVSGRLDDKYVKGLDIALGAAGQALDALRLAGRGPMRVVLRGAAENDHAALRELAENPRLRVVPRAFVTDEETLREDLAGASLLLMPSRSEGFGLVGAEAIVAGVPVLVSADSGLGYLLKRLAPDLTHDSIVPMTGVKSKDNGFWAERITAVLMDVPGAFAKAAEIRKYLAAQRTWAKAADYVLQTARQHASAG
ncbi:glycosyltransferase [Amycolatopsis sp. NPDC024027]|uniref:glycosyltransferase n=1 Tax=Amycolatopsis sp. NPDC024027 TaxID=3154327 RepID=UPI0033F95BAA